MAYLTDSWLTDIALSMAPLLYLVYWLITYNDDYWDRRGVPNTKRGLVCRTLLGRQSQGDQVKDIYYQFPDERFVGFFQMKKPTLMLRDVDLIHRVLVKDFTYFQDRGQPQVPNDPLSENLFSLRGQIWRALRYKLTPTFTTGKLKGMFEQVSKCGDNMIQRIDGLRKDASEVESRSFVFDYTLDVISSCAFGVQFKTGSRHYNMLKYSIQQIFKTTPALFFRIITLLMAPRLAKYFKMTLFPRDIGEYFMAMTKSNVKYRKDNNIQRNDYFQLLLNLREQEDSGKDLGLSMADACEEDDIIDQMKYAEKSTLPVSKSQTTNVKLMTDERICGNSFIFMIAGSESVTTTIAHALYDLARHPAYQKTLQEEIDSVLDRHGGKWSYQALKEMTYLDQVVQESQRMHPLIPLLVRECVEPYRIPDSDVIIEKGVQVLIPVSGLHCDPRHYPQPDVFDPERFKNNNFKPNSAFLPFGDGPRICIALRFAVMEVKSCVGKILSQYSIGLSPKTSVPLKMNPRSFVPTPVEGIWLTLDKRNKISTDL